MDYLRTIRLGYGKGKPGKQACWMTALQAHIGGEWTDRCACVDPVINQLCIWINDQYGKDAKARTDDIMAFGLFVPLGTLGDEESTKRRMYHLLDVAIRKWVPLIFRDNNLEKEAMQIESCERITDSISFLKSCDMVNEAYNKLITRSYWIFNDGRYVDYFVYIMGKVRASVGVDSAVALATTIGSYACKQWHDFKWHNFAKKHVYPLLRELIDMGPCAPQEPDLPVCGINKFLEAVGATP